MLFGFTKLSRVFVIGIVMMLLWACAPNSAAVPPSPTSTVPPDTLKTQVAVDSKKPLVTEIPKKPESPLLGIPIEQLETDHSPVSWATAQNKVLIRWYGREAAGLPKYEEDENNLPTVLPGSPGTPSLRVERRDMPNGDFKVIKSGISRQYDLPTGESGDWWQEVTDFTSNTQQQLYEFNPEENPSPTEPSDISLSEVYAVFDNNPMAVEFWSAKHHELSLLLGMGFLDTSIKNGSKVQYRVSLEGPGADIKILGATDQIKVGAPKGYEPQVYVSSDTSTIFGAETEIDETETHDANWLVTQAARRWTNQRIYVGWQYDVSISQNPITVTGYNVYRYPVNVNLQTTGESVQVNNSPVLPGGSSQDWVQESSSTDQIIGVDPENGELIYDLANPTPLQGHEDENVPPGYFVVDNPNQDLSEEDQYCYKVAPIDYLGNEGARWPADFEDENCAHFLSQTPPDSPIQITGELINGAVVLNWPEVEGAGSYSVYRAQVGQGQPYPSGKGEWIDITGDGDFQIDGEAVAFVDESAIPVPVNEEQELDYWYRVRSWDEDDQSGNRSPLSQPVFVFMRDSTPPGEPELSISKKHGAGEANTASYIKGPCIKIVVDPSDTDYIQIYRKIDDGSYELIATIPIDDGVSVVEWCDPSLAGLTGHAEAEYIAQAHDSDGNYSWSSEFTIGFGDGSLFDPPIILEVVEEEENGSPVHVVKWIADKFPAFDRFNIYMFNDFEPLQHIGELETAEATDLGNGYLTGTFKHYPENIENASKVTYQYTVSSFRDGLPPKIASIERFSEAAELLTKDGKIAVGQSMHIGLFRWCADPALVPEEGGVELNWGKYAEIPEKPGDYSVGCEETDSIAGSASKQSESESGDDFAYLIFRSRHKDSGYVQIAPVLGRNINAPFYGNVREPSTSSGAPLVKRGLAFIDKEASHGAYWYVVVAIDALSGDTKYATSPKSLTLDALPKLAGSEPASGKCEQHPMPDVGTFEAPSTLVFGPGERYEASVFVCKWTDTRQLSRTSSGGTFAGSGNGYAVFSHPSGSKSYAIKVSFEDIKADSDGEVLSGGAKASHDPILINNWAGLDFSVSDIKFVSSGDLNGANAKITVHVGETMTFVESGQKTKLIDIANTGITENFQFIAEKTLASAIPDAAYEAVPDNQFFDWSELIDWYFVMDELPLGFITKSLIIRNETITSNADVTGHYYERYNGRGIIGPVDRTPENTRPNSNDAILQHSIYDANAFQIHKKGLDTQLKSKASVEAVVSIPYSSKISAEEAVFDISSSLIKSGGLGAGTASTKYISDPETQSTNLLTSEFDESVIGEGGDIEGKIRLTSDISWLPNGFSIPEENSFESALYVPPIYSVEQPSNNSHMYQWVMDPDLLFTPGGGRIFNSYPDKSLWSPTVTGTLNIGDPSGALSVQTIVGEQMWIYPGFTFRETGQVKWECAGTEMNVESYLNVASVGVSNAMSVIVPEDGIGVLIEDYKTKLSRFDMRFNHSYINNKPIVDAEIYLPYPADFSFAGRVSKFDGGCIKEIQASAGGTEVSADYWNLAMLPSVAEFLEVPEEDGKRLFLNGGIRLPHMYEPNGEPTKWSAIKSRWEPDGKSKGTIFNQVPATRFDGLAYQLKPQNGVTLRNPSLTDPQIEQVANVNNQPDCNTDCPGWISYKGSVTTPYFGALVSTVNSEPDVELHVFTSHAETENVCARCVDYVGSSGLSAKQVWISEAGLELDYPLVISKNQDFGISLIGLDRVSVLPYDALEIISFDTSAVIDSEISEGSIKTSTGLFLGLASVPAAVKALNESINGSTEQPPNEENMNRWLKKFIGNGGNKPISESTFDLYTGSAEINGPEDCQSVLYQIWGDGNWDFNDTYELIDDPVLNQSYCFDVAHIEQQIENDINPNTLIALLELGGGVGAALKYEDEDSAYVTEFHQVRGNVLFTENSVGGSDFDRFDLALRIKIAEGDDIFLRTPSLSLSYDKSGDFTIAGQNVEAHMFTYDIDAADFLLTVSTGEENVGINGGVTYYDGVNFEVVEISVLSGVFGLGEDVLYVGVTGSGQLVEDWGDESGSVGASMLFGRINQSSATVLAADYPDLIERLPLEDAMTGVYMRALGDFPIIQDGCLLSLNVGGEIEIWYFTGEETAYGGSLRGFAYGEALCVISGRGDVTLTFSHEGEDAQKFEGEGWLAGGIGWDCDPGTWGPTWNGRWWGDSWCWQAGMAADLRWRSGGDGWSYSTDADYE